MISTLCKDPFRLFFPIAIFCLLYGTGLWISSSLFEMGGFPIEEHAHLFLGGFLYFSILGFLLTALPRFTFTEFLSKTELFLFLLVIIFVLLFYFIENQSLFWLSIFTGWLTFLVFALKRFFKRKQNPPFTFIFVGLGVFIGLSGSLLNFLSLTFSETFDGLQRWGKLLFYDAMVMSFILGVGGRLIPGILGFVEVIKEQRANYERDQPFLSVVPKFTSFSFFLFILSFLLEGGDFARAGYILRTFVITMFALKYWRLHEKVKTRKWHGRMLKVSCLFLLISSWLLCFFVDEAIHIKHLAYIGSYCLMTIMIASRVILAHGHEGLGIEGRKFPFLIVGGLIILAALTRGTAHLMPESYLNHLGYAALVLLLSVTLWFFYFLKRLFTFK